QRGACTREPFNQAAPAPLQHPPPGRQDIPVREADLGREISEGLCDTAAQERWQRLLWPLLSRQSGLQDCGSDSPQFFGSILHRGLDALSSPSLSAVLYRTLPRSVLCGPDYSWDLPGGGT